MVMSNELEPGKLYRWSSHPNFVYYLHGNSVFGSHKDNSNTLNDFPCPMMIEEPVSMSVILDTNTAREIQYKYNEPALLEDLSKYVDETYSEHYSQTSFQSTEVIIDSGHGVGFCLGNVLKYANRYGRKDGFNRKDLFKILHYTLIAIFIHDKENKDG